MAEPHAALRSLLNSSPASVPGLICTSRPPSRMLPPRPSICLLLGQDVDHRVRRVGVDLGAVGVRQAADVAGELDHRHLEAVADAQVRQLVLAGVADAGDLALRPADAEPAGHDDAVQRRPGARPRWRR